jgi:Recombination endonuclease VII
MRDGRQTYCRDCFAAIYRERRRVAGLVSRPRHIPEGHKFCRACAQYKPLDDFGGRTGKSSSKTFQCNDCMRTRDRARHLATSYGMSVDAVEKLLASQGGTCAICRVAPAVHVDHDHATGTVRGMRCFRCNVALGHFEDTPATILRAARYLMTAGRWESPIEAYFTQRLAEVDVGHAS